MSLKKRLFVAICGVTLCVGAANAQVVVRVGPRRRSLLNVRDGLCMRDGYGYPDITAGPEDDMSGFLDAGQLHRGLAQSGSPADGSLAVVAGSTSTDIGAKVNSWSTGRDLSRLPRHNGHRLQVTPICPKSISPQN
jgi:hypothetical protein